MITFRSGDLFNSGAEAIVVTTNCVGVMGTGVAEGVKARWPAVFEAYRVQCGMGLSCLGERDAKIGGGKFMQASDCCKPGASCLVHQIRPGVVTHYETGASPTKLVLSVPTKRHWNGPSLMEDVDAGIPALAAAISHLGLASLAVPPLGCGRGGLRWQDVRPKMVAGLGDLQCEVIIYGEAPAPAEMITQQRLR